MLGLCTAADIWLSAADVSVLVDVSEGSVLLRCSSEALRNSLETHGGALQPLPVERAKSSELGRGWRKGLLEVLGDTINVGLCLYVGIGRRVLG